jgi:hypothetical protein
MIPQVPWYLTLIVLAVNLGIVAVLWRIVAAKQPRGIRIGVAAFLAARLGSVLLLAPSPASLAVRNPYFITPLIPFFAIVPAAFVLLAVALSARLRAALGAASLPALVGVQLYRALGAIFLLLMVMGQVPGYFAKPAGWGDIVVGLSAPLVALALLRRSRGSTPLGYAWNVVGLLDLFVAVGMGTGILPQFIQAGVEGRVPSAAVMGVFPMLLVPAFLVPVSIMLHVIALVRLRKLGSATTATEVIALHPETRQRLPRAS